MHAGQHVWRHCRCGSLVRLLFMCGRQAITRFKINSISKAPLALQRQRKDDKSKQKDDSYGTCSEAITKHRHCHKCCLEHQYKHKSNVSNKEINAVTYQANIHPTIDGTASRLYCLTRVLLLLTVLTWDVRATIHIISRQQTSITSDTEMKRKSKCLF